MNNLTYKQNITPLAHPCPACRTPLLSYKPNEAAEQTALWFCPLGDYQQEISLNPLTLHE